MNEIIVNESPIIKQYNTVFSKDLCDEIINWGSKRLVPGKIVSPENADLVINTDYRDVSIAQYTNKEIPHYDFIVDTISKLTGINKDRFESFSLTNYKEGQEFKLHADFFVHRKDNVEHNKKIEQLCSYGGNRLQTIIVYLNDVEDGGETFFPWISKIVLPKTGRVCQFVYDYEDPTLNVKTYHCSLPVLKGEKWILTTWIREQPLQDPMPNFKKFELESDYYSNLRDVSYSIECGPEWDKKVLEIQLPKNTSPMNGIAVAVSGGFESSLLLYLIAVLNKYQKIPYAIVPVLASEGYVDGAPVYRENARAIERLIEFINQKDVPYVRRLVSLHPTPDDLELGNLSALKKVFLEKPTEEVRCVHYAKFQYLYFGTNALPNDSDERWQNIPFKRIKSYNYKIVQPFFNLQKYHIVDAIIKLGLHEIFEIVGPCGIGHTSLTENCTYFACNERRWGFSKLGLFDLADKYLIVKENTQ